MGHWTGNTFHLGNNIKLNVITSYRVIEQELTSINSLTNNAQQPEVLLDRIIDSIILDNNLL
jgi:hypothetical protein